MTVFGFGCLVGWLVVFFLMSTQKSGSILAVGKQHVICAGSLEKRQLCSSFNLTLCYFSHVTEESR